MIPVKTLLAPGTLPFAILVGGVGAVLMLRRGNKRRLGAALVALLLISYFALSLPSVAHRLSTPLIQFGRLPERAGEHVSAIVVLDGDSQRARVLETLRLSRILANCPIIVSGPLEMRDKLVDAGVPADRLLMESTAETTRQQAVNVAQIIRSNGFRRVVLIASAIHMPRALAAFRAAGVDAIPSASATRPIVGLPGYWPAYNALRLSRESIYEYAALVYYKSRGWR